MCARQLEPVICRLEGRSRALFWCVTAASAAARSSPAPYTRALFRGEKGPAPMKIGRAPRTFQELIFTLQRYWSDEGCMILEPYDMEVGAGTFHTATFLRAVGPEPWRAAYVKPSRRPTAATARTPFAFSTTTSTRS